jgi:hypothetical protein
LKTFIKGIVQRDLTGVETRLKRSVLMNLIVAKSAFLNFKGTPSREEHKTGFSVLTTTELNLPVEFTEFCKRRPPYILFKETMYHKLRAKSYALKALIQKL